MTAQEYLREVQERVSRGEDINRIEPKESVLFHYLERYYSDIYENRPEEEETAEILTLPLQERADGVFEALSWLFAHGADPNTGEEWRPLMSSVSNMDASVTEYLIQNGADPNYDDGEEIAEGVPFGSGNWYIDELDIFFFHGLYHASQSVFEAAINTVAVLAAHGVTANGKYCITIDPANRTVKVDPPQMKY